MTMGVLDPIKNKAIHTFLLKVLNKYEEDLD